MKRCDLEAQPVTSLLTATSDNLWSLTQLSIYASRFSTKDDGVVCQCDSPSHVSLQNNDDVGDQIYEMRFRQFRCKYRFCLQIVLFQACVFCSILFGHNWSETLKVFEYRNEVGFVMLIFMSHCDDKHKNINLLLFAFI
jgi:hypothetical protein